MLAGVFNCTYFPILEKLARLFTLFFTVFEGLYSFGVINVPTIAVVFYWRNQINKSGLDLIDIPISINNTHKYYKIDILKKIKVDQWRGKEDAWVKSMLELAFEINYSIIEKKNIINNLIKRS
jgi:hypothetical protein